MKRAFVAGVLLAAGCGVCHGGRELTLLKASVGVAATELGSSARPDIVAMVEQQLHAPDPGTQALGKTECVLLQARAQALGRELAAAVPVLSSDKAIRQRAERASAALNGAIHCEPQVFKATAVVETVGAQVQETQRLLSQLH